MSEDKIEIEPEAPATETPTFTRESYIREELLGHVETLIRLARQREMGGYDCHEEMESAARLFQAYSASAAAEKLALIQVRLYELVSQMESHEDAIVRAFDVLGGPRT